MNHIRQAMERLSHRNFTEQDLALWYPSKTAFDVRLSSARKLLKPWTVRIRGKLK